VPLQSRTDSNLDPRATMPAADLPGDDGKQASASLSAQVETLLALWYRLRSFVYKYAGKQEIKEPGRRDRRKWRGESSRRNLIPPLRR